MATAIQPVPRAVANRRSSSRAFFRTGDDLADTGGIGGVQCADQDAVFRRQGKLDTGVDDNVGKTHRIDKGVVVLVAQRHQRVARAHHRLHASGDGNAVAGDKVRLRLRDATVGRSP